MNVPFARRLIVLLVALALLSLQLVRAEHVHPAGVEGRTRSLVHSHGPGPATPSGERAYAGHGDHRLAIFLVAVYESVLRDPARGTPDGVAVMYDTPDGVPRFHTVRALCPAADRHPPGRPVFASQGRAPPLC